MIKKGFLIAAGVLCFVLAGYLIYRIARPSGEYGPELTPLRMRLAEDLVPQAVKDFRGQLPPEFFEVVLLQFQGHRNAVDIRKMVEEQIRRDKALHMNTMEEVAEKAEDAEGMLDKVKGFTKGLAEKVGIGVPEPGDEVKKAAKEAGIDGYVGAEVFFQEGSPDEEFLRITLYANDVEGKEIRRKDYEASLDKSIFDLTYYRVKVRELGVGWKLLIWIVFTLALPVATFFIPAKAIKSESNGAVLAALVGYTALDGLVALALLGFSIGGFFSFLFLLCALGLGGFYNWGMFTEIRDFV